MYVNIISEKAKIGKNVKIGNFVSIYDDVEIGDNSVIESYCEIGYSNGREKGPLQIGRNSRIRSHSILYAGSQIGENLVTGHHVTIRENMKIGVNFQLGTLSDLQGDSTIGDYVKTQSNVFIAQYSRLGDYIWLLPYALLANDPHPPSDEVTKGPEISDFAVLAARCIIFPHLKVGRGALVGAGCVLRQDLPDNQIAVGNPGRIIGPTSKVKIKGTDKPAYPWRYHFHRGYPKEITDRWMNELC
jgi:acetyltransferase-like isoleucine patch superfamily enzyme